MWLAKTRVPTGLANSSAHEVSVIFVTLLSRLASQSPSLLHNASHRPLLCCSFLQNKTFHLEVKLVKTQGFLRQWISIFLVLPPITTVPHVVVTPPAIQLFSLPLRNFILLLFGIIRKYLFSDGFP